MKFNLFIVSLFFLLSLNISAQVGQFSSQFNIETTIPNGFHVKVNGINSTVDLTKTSGSPYENDKFVFGKASDKLTNLSQAYFLRYNVYNDEIEMKITVDDKKTLGLIKSLNNYAVFGNKEYHYEIYSDNNKNTNEGYFILLSKGKNSSLYLKKVKTFKDEQKAKDSFREKVSCSFKDSKIYYIKKERILHPLSNKKKELLVQLSDKENELKKFIKTEKLNLKKEKDLITLFKYYDSLSN